MEIRVPCWKCHQRGQTRDDCNICDGDGWHLVCQTVHCATCGREHEIDPDLGEHSDPHWCIARLGEMIDRRDEFIDTLRDDRNQLLEALGVEEVASGLAIIRKFVPHLVRGEGRQERPYERTCRLLGEYLRDNPGARVKDAIADVEHHWTSDTEAVERLVQLLNQGAVHGVDAVIDAGVMRLYPAGRLPEGAASVARSAKVLDDAGIKPREPHKRSVQDMRVRDRFGPGRFPAY